VRFENNFKKPLDKVKNICYNKDVKNKKHFLTKKGRKNYGKEN
jgi:hypothetical protein